MFRFSNPEYLYLLIAIPALFLLLLASRRNQLRKLKMYGNPELLAQLMPDISGKRPLLKNILQLLAITVCIFMIAGPQFGTKKGNTKRQSSDIMIAMDISNSMMAEDIIPNRLEKSKQVVSKLVDKMQEDRIGLVVFAGQAFTQLPITSDYVSAKVFLSTISPSMIQSQGTAIGAAIDQCIRSFGPKRGNAERAIILITDGENFEDDAVESAKNAVKQGIKVHVVAMGDVKGAPIPLGNGTDFRKDRNGNVIVTKLNEKMCQEIAGAGKGLYIRSDNTTAALRALSKELDKMDKADTDSSSYSEYDEQFQSLAWIVLFALLADIFILERKSKIFRNVKLFKP